jgi:DNA excision repair protein ERCC-3
MAEADLEADNETENFAAPRDEHGAYDFRGVLSLKPDHESRPIFVSPDYHVFLETFSPIYKQAYDFLIAIAEPISRPEHIHEYELTQSSLYAAASVGLSTAAILEYLNRLCKTELPERVVDFVKTNTSKYGKVKLVLKAARYYIESTDATAMQALLKDPVIAAARVRPEGAAAAGDASVGDSGLVETMSTRSGPSVIAGVAAKRTGGELTDEVMMAVAAAAEAGQAIPADLQDYITMVDADEDTSAPTRVLTFEVIGGKELEKVQRQCVVLDYPLLAEYDFRHDTTTPNMRMDLKPTCVLRPYQEKSLRKMFGNGRARSGMIVLPCGAGKTLTGVTAACTIKKRTIVVCPNIVSANQWRDEFLRWSSIDVGAVRCFTSKDRSMPPANCNCVMICTYSMLARKERRTGEADRVFQARISWAGLFVLCDSIAALWLPRTACACACAFVTDCCGRQSLSRLPPLTPSR